MRLPVFDHQAPEKLSDLLALKGDLGAQAAVLAGGTDLLVRLKKRLLQPGTVLSLSRIPELAWIQVRPETVTLGAGARLHQVLGHPLVPAEFQGLTEALARLGAPSLQAFSATIGGNVLLETRCLFHDQSPLWRRGLERCFKAGGQVCLALPESKACNSVYLADGGTALLAHSALVKIQSRRGERLIPLGKLFTGQGERPFDLAPEEILTGILLPRPVGPVGSAFEKLSYRSAVDFALVSAAAVVSLNRGRVDRVKLVVGAAGPRPVEAAEAEAVLRGQTPDQDRLERAAQAAALAAAGTMVENLGVAVLYRRDMVRVVARRALQKALLRAGRGELDLTGLIG